MPACPCTRSEKLLGRRASCLLTFENACSMSSSSVSSSSSSSSEESKVSPKENPLPEHEVQDEEEDVQPVENDNIEDANSTDYVITDAVTGEGEKIKAKPASDNGQDGELEIDFSFEINETKTENVDLSKFDGNIAAATEVLTEKNENSQPKSTEVSPADFIQKENNIECPKEAMMDAQRSMERVATSEVVEESLRSVKEQIAAFKEIENRESVGKLKMENTSGLRNAPPTAYEPSPIPPKATNPEIVHKNVLPKPFVVAQTAAMHSAPAAPLEPQTSPFAAYSSAAKFERPVPFDRREELAPTPKKFVFNPPQTTSVMSFGVPFTTGKISSSSSSHVSHTPKALLKEAKPVQYLGPEIISRSTGPPLNISLRRHGPEVPWGFAVFGGADYGCPPFISRVTLHSIAADEGLEVGDILLSICDAPIQGKSHSDVKAEILRAGNELEFRVIKQGIDKEVLAQRIPQKIMHPLRSDVLDRDIGSPQHYLLQNQQQRLDSTSPPRRPGTWSSRTGYQYQQDAVVSCAPHLHADKATRSRSYRLLDEHLNMMSLHPRPPQPVDAYSTKTYYPSGQQPRSSFTVSRAQDNNNESSKISSNNLSNHAYAAPARQPQARVREIELMKSSHAYMEPPAAGLSAHPSRPSYSQHLHQHSYHHQPPTPLESSHCGGALWASSTASKSALPSAANDPDLVTQYYGTQQTSIAKYHRTTTQQQQQQQHKMHQSACLDSGGFEWDTDFHRNRPTYCDNYGSPVEQYHGRGLAIPGPPSTQGLFRGHPGTAANQRFASASSYRDQENWATTGTVQNYGAGWM